MTDLLPASTDRAVDLGDRTVHRLAGRLGIPGYDRSRLTPAVVHIGVGNFHRAHQAVYLDDLARTGETGWGVVGVSLRSPTIGRALAPQDNLFTVVERDAYGDQPASSAP